MTEFGGWITGIAPKKSELIRMRLNLNIIRKFEREIEELQVNNGFTFISEAQVIWRDLSYAFEILNGVKNSGLITLFGNRLCLTKKIFLEYPDTKEGILLRLFTRKRALGYKRKYSIIGPYTLYRISDTINYDKEKLVTKIYEKILEESIELEFDAVDLHEPYIGYEKDADRWLARRLYTLIDSFPSLKIFVYPYYIDYSKKLSLLMDISRDGILIDMNYMGLDELTPLPVDRIIIGLDDILTGEDTVPLSQRIKHLIRDIHFREVDITYPYSINTLSFKTMIDKIRLIGSLLKVFKNEGEYEV